MVSVGVNLQQLSSPIANCLIQLIWSISITRHWSTDHTAKQVSLNYWFLDSCSESLSESLSSMSTVGSTKIMIKKMTTKIMIKKSDNNTDRKTF